MARASGAEASASTPYILRLAQQTVLTITPRCDRRQLFAQVVIRQFRSVNLIGARSHPGNEFSSTRKRDKRFEIEGSPVLLLLKCQSVDIRIAHVADQDRCVLGIEAHPHGE